MRKFYDDEEKGLFTFYREQAEFEEEMKRLKKLNKEAAKGICMN